jgi:hypothetical protein
MSTVLDHPRATAPVANDGAASSKNAHRLSIARHLIATMMVGQVYGLRDDVTLIFDALSAMMGDGRQLRISLAFASALGGDVTPAHELLADGVLDDWPAPHMARVSLALALKVGGDPQWTAVAEKVLAISDDEETRRFARQVLDTPNSSSLEL